MVPSVRQWVALPLVDELWNTFGDVYEWATGGLPADAVAPMTALHAAFALALLVLASKVYRTGQLDSKVKVA